MIMMMMMARMITMMMLVKMMMMMATMMVMMMLPEAEEEGQPSKWAAEPLVIGTWVHPLTYKTLMRSTQLTSRKKMIRKTYKAPLALSPNLLG